MKTLNPGNRTLNPPDEEKWWSMMGTTPLWIAYHRQGRTNASSSVCTITYYTMIARHLAGGNLVELLEQSATSQQPIEHIRSFVLTTRAWADSSLIPLPAASTG
jgi:hypothetical protein